MGVSRACLACALAVLAVGGAAGARDAVRASGAIAGTITTSEAARSPIRVTVDPNVCGGTVPDTAIAIDQNGHLANAVVTVTGVNRAAPAEAVIANDKCAFVPRVSIMRPGGTVKMSSKDATLHTMHAAGGDGRAFFNISLPIPNVTISRPLNTRGVVTLSCSTHTWMRGYLVMTDELAAVSDANGRFRLDNVPAGTHELRVWHEVLKTAPVNVAVRDSETTTVNLSLTK